MKNKPAKEKYVTVAVFNKGIQSLHNKIAHTDKNVARLEKKIDESFAYTDKNVVRLDKKIDNVAFSVLKINDRLTIVEKTMATKDDLNQMVDKIDHLFKKYREFDQEEGVQSFHLRDVQRKMDDHERRLTVLETSR